MEHLNGLLKLVDKEFADMEQNGKFRNREDVELAYKLIDIAKDVYCVWDYEDNMEDDYSEYGYPMRKAYPYDDGMSYARGRGAKRNSMGQYSRDGMNYNGHVSMRGGRGYSRNDAKDEYVENLRELMMNAPDDRTREHLQRMIDDMER